MFNRGRPPGILKRRDAKGHAPSEEYWLEKQRKQQKQHYDKTKEQKNEINRIKRQNDPEYREKQRAKWRAKYHKHSEAYNKRRIENSRKNKVKYRKTWNEWYERVKHTKRGLQLASRIRNSPLYGLEKSLREFEARIIGGDELTRRYDQAFARLNEKCRGIGADFEPFRQIFNSPADSGDSEGTEQVDET